MSPINIITITGQNLNNYYLCQPDWFAQTRRDKKVRLIKATPYDTQETLYWFCKHLALPGGVTACIAVILILTLFENPIFELISSILFYVSLLLLLSVLRERIRAWKYKIKGIEIKEPGISHEINTLRELGENEKYFKIGFVGDIMMMKRFNLTFSKAIKTFFKDVNLIVGNLEGLLSIQPGPISKQKHKDTFLNQLAKLLENNDLGAQWLLCKSNNHSADFAFANFNYSLYRIQWRPEFHVFGRRDVPNVVIDGENINIASGSEWSNQKNWSYISEFVNQELQDNFSIDNFNILFPHWGYENEKYIRARIQKDAKALLTGEPQTYSWFQKKMRKWLHKEIEPGNWDLIFGQHSHVRQPIMTVCDNENNVNKLVAFSGGNFTSGAIIMRRKKHIHGLIMKCDIGPLDSNTNKLAIGNVEYQNTKNKIVKLYPPTKEVQIDLDKERKYNRGALIRGIILFVLIAMLRIFVLFH